RGLARRDDARPRLGRLLAIAPHRALDQPVDAFDDLRHERLDLLQDGAYVVSERCRVESVTFEAPPLASEVACEGARMTRDTGGEALGVARDVAREVLGRMADVVPVATALPM